ncbi:MAG: glycosyltransferase family 2 protein [Alsobacter sp.]
MQASAVDTNSMVSIVLPVFNGERYLRQTLDSILAQDYAAFEILCVNDCSTDRSADILEAYRRDDDRVVVLTTPENLGISPKSVAFALPHMRGRYFLYMSQDDLLSKDCLLRLVERSRETGADAVIPDVAFYIESETAQPRPTLAGLRGDRSVILQPREAVALALDCTIPGNALWNADLVRRLGIQVFGTYADEYTVRVWFMNCNRVAFASGVFFYRQDNPNAITKKLTAKTFDRAENHLVLYKFLKDNRFEQSLYRKELLDCVYLLYHLQRLVDDGRYQFPNDDREDARARIAKCVRAIQDTRCLSDSLFSRRLLVKLLAIKLGYGPFVLAVRGATWLRGALRATGRVEAPLVSSVEEIPHW